MVMVCGFDKPSSEYSTRYPLVNGNLTYLSYIIRGKILEMIILYDRQYGQKYIYMYIYIYIYMLLFIYIYMKVFGYLSLVNPRECRFFV